MVPPIRATRTALVGVVGGGVVEAASSWWSTMDAYVAGVGGCMRAWVRTRPGRGRPVVRRGRLLGGRGTGQVVDRPSVSELVELNDENAPRVGHSDRLAPSRGRDLKLIPYVPQGGPRPA